MLKDGVPLICVNTGCELEMKWWENEKKNRNITKYKFHDGCSIFCIDISRLDKDVTEEFNQILLKKLRQSKQILLEKVKKNLSSKPYIFYRDLKGLMKLFSEISYFFRHKTPISWFFRSENQYHDKFFQTLKESGIGDEEAKNMTKTMELNF